MRKLLLVLTLFLSLTGPAWAAVALDTTSSSTSTSSATLTWAHTCTGSNLVLAVYASHHDGSVADRYPTSVTYNGDALTEATTTRRDPDTHSGSWWYLVNPDTGGAYDIVITYANSNTAIVGVAHSYTGAAQTGQPDAQGGGTDNATSPISWTHTTVAANSMIVAALSQEVNWGDVAASAPLTQRVAVTAYADLETTSGDYILATAGGQSVTFTFGDFAGTYGGSISLAPVVTTSIKTVNGLANASVKTVNGLARASVKTVNGLA